MGVRGSECLGGGRLACTQNVGAAQITGWPGPGWHSQPPPPHPSALSQQGWREGRRVLVGTKVGMGVTGGRWPPGLVGEAGREGRGGPSQSCLRLGSPPPPTPRLPGKPHSRTHLTSQELTLQVQEFYPQILRCAPSQRTAPQKKQNKTGPWHREGGAGTQEGGGGEDPERSPFGFRGEGWGRGWRDGGGFGGGPLLFPKESTWCRGGR